nr:hypothetical protein [Tanacetum cinerariifolium]
MLKLLASYNVELAKVVLENAPFNSKYNSGDIQKEILSIIANKVRKHIRSEVGNSYFCVMVDEARDESKKEQMAIVLRFVDNDGVIRESEVIPIHQFFTKLSSNINLICASSKRHDELLKARSTEIEHLLELGEIKHGRGKYQVGTLKRANDTSKRHDELLKARSTEIEHLLELGEIKHGRGKYQKIMGRTDILSQALQKKNQDIGNAIDLVSATKESLNDFRNNRWDSFHEKVIIFSKNHQIDIPDMNALYKSSCYRPRQNDNLFTFEHYYRAEVFISLLDKQLHELNNRFNDHAMDLLTLGSALVPKNDSNGYNIDEICQLVEKYYPVDFTEQERIRLSFELKIFNIERSRNPKLSKVSTIAELCKVLVETKKPESYYLLDRLIRLILTLPVSTTTAESGFSAMKICKSRLRNRMSGDFLADSLVVYIEKEVAENFDSESVIDEFKSLKPVEPICSSFNLVIICCFSFHDFV